MKATKRPKQNLTLAIRHLIEEESIPTQHVLIEKLQRLGHDTNQSKVSRILRKLTVIKTKGPHGKMIYTLPKEPPPTLSQNNELGHLLLKITANESMIVIHTSPGSASLIARSLDFHHKSLHILGTIAGDDTIFIAPNDGTTPPTIIIEKIKSFFKIT